jgi:hypothetical protein
MLFSMDIDWAPEEVIADSIALFEERGVKCTFFATHDSAVLRSCNRKLFEIGIHPNFNPLLKGQSTQSADQVVKDLLAIYPETKGARSHSLTQSGPILDVYRNNGLVYECNHFLPYHHGLGPFVLWNGLLRIPFNWEDDYHFALGKSFESCGLDLENSNELLFFNFHPAHIFLNSESMDRYLMVREDFNSYAKLKEKINKSTVKGTRDILLYLLDHVAEKKIKTQTLSEYSKEVELQQSIVLKS